MKHLNKILLSSALAVFILLAQFVRAETITQTTSSEQPIEIEERWVSAMEDIQQGHYDRAIPVLLNYAKSITLYSIPAKIQLGEVYFTQGLKQAEANKIENLKLSYRWSHAAYREGIATSYLPRDVGPLRNGALPYRLGYLCELGAASGDDDSNIDEADCAVHWYSLAAQEGHAAAKARLGYIYFDGLYQTDRDADLAYSYFRAALEQPEFKEQELLPRTSLAIATLIIRQLGTDEPRENAVRYIKIAANGNVPEAKYLLGVLYERGLFGVARDEGKAAFLKNEAQEELTPREVEIYERLLSDVDA